MLVLKAPKTEKGNEIPLPARIIAIADTYSAITMRRAYKPPRTHEEAVAIILEVAGTQLDAQLVDIFLSIPKEELIGCMLQLSDVRRVIVHELQSQQ